jgi:uncharacterized protein
MTSGRIDLQQILGNLAADSLNRRPPVERWNPAVVQDIDIEIRHDGLWWHEGTRIERFELVKLFASILIRQDDDYFLVTPTEKCRVRVADVPFIIDAVVVDLVDARSAQPSIRTIKCVTNLGEEVMLGAQHPLTLKTDANGTPIPYVMVRNGMQARFGRNAYYELVAMSCIEHDGEHDIAVLRLPEMSFSLGAI